MTNKCFRIFASKDPNDQMLLKKKDSKENGEKFANTPERCFIDNGDIVGATVPDKLDKNWYINVTKDRLKKKFDMEGEDDDFV